MVHYFTAHPNILGLYEVVVDQLSFARHFPGGLVLVNTSMAAPAPIVLQSYFFG